MSIKNKKVILAFGYLPKQFGGRQTSGLATGLFDLNNAINTIQSNFEVVIGATDYKNCEGKVINSKVLGPCFLSMLKYSILNILNSLFYIREAFIISNRYGQPMIRTWAKLIFLDYCIYKVDPDILHLHGAIRGYLGMKAKRSNNIFKVLRIHGIVGFDEKVPNYMKLRKLEQYVAENFKGSITFVTSLVRDRWGEVYGRTQSKAYVILNGFDDGLFFPPSPDNKKGNGNKDKKIKLLTIASISDRKGQIRVVKAINKLSNKEDYTYICIGQGSKEKKSQLRETGSKYKIDLHVYDYVPQGQLRKYIISSDYMILPSSSEGFGKVFIESIACGTPIIIPENLPLAKELGVLNENNAIFIKGSDINSIYRCLSQLPRPKRNKQKISETVSHLRWNNIASRYVNVLNDVYEE